MTRLVFLVPGFFGFSTLGSVSYFNDVEQALARGFRKRGLEMRLVRTPTQPTGSIRRRADQLRRHVIAHGGLKAQELHFVGHSTGGLDVRMMLTPGVNLVADDTEERIGRRTRSAISVTTPHHGTPLANFFSTTQGHRLLLLLTSLATSYPGRGAILAASRSLALLARMDRWRDRDGGQIDRALRALLLGMTFDRKDPVWRYLDAIGSDQGAILQLTPEAIDLFDASVTDRPGIDYSCVVAGVPEPHERLRPGALLHPQQIALRALFRLLHGITADDRKQYPYPEPAATTRRKLQKQLGFDVDQRTNDGVVPTLSQLHGRILHIARADHLDIVGHFTLAAENTGDWLPSGAGFTTEAFAVAWDGVAAAIAANSRGRGARR